MDSQFDPEQGAVWSVLRAINDAWTQGDPATLAEYFHPDMIAVTASDRLRRIGRQECIAGWQEFATTATIHAWQEIDPLIRVFGNAAVVSYYYELDCNVGGSPRHFAGRDLFFFICDNGRWWAVADQFSGYPETTG